MALAVALYLAITTAVGILYIKVMLALWPTTTTTTRTPGDPT